MQDQDDLLDFIALELHDLDGKLIEACPGSRCVGVCLPNGFLLWGTPAWMDEDVEQNVVVTQLSTLEGDIVDHEDAEFPFTYSASLEERKRMWIDGMKRTIESTKHIWSKA